MRSAKIAVFDFPSKIMSDLSVAEEGILEELLVYLEIHQEPRQFLDSLVKGGDQDGISAPESLALKSGRLALDTPIRFLSMVNRIKTLKTHGLEPLLYVLESVQNDPTIQQCLDGLSIADGTTMENSNTFESPASYLKKSGSTSNISSTFLNKTPATPRLPRQNSLQFTPKRFLGSAALAAERSGGSGRTPKSILKHHATPGAKQAPAVLTPLFSTIGELDCQIGGKNPSITCKEKTAKEQEAFIIDDLLYVLMVVSNLYRVQMVNLLQARILD